MDNHHILSDEEHMEASLIHKNGHWTQPPPLLQTVKLVHRSSVLGGCLFINYILFSLIISSPNIYLLNIPSSFSPHPSKHNQNKKLLL